MLEIDVSLFITNGSNTTDIQMSYKRLNEVDYNIFEGISFDKLNTANPSYLNSQTLNIISGVPKISSVFIKIYFYKPPVESDANQKYGLVLQANYTDTSSFQSLLRGTCYATRTAGTSNYPGFLKFYSTNNTMTGSYNITHHFTAI